ncbi:T9SS type A sorting domain-containing protein [Sporocytophaga myxococcoides]|uniref:T9SS type A sorting domain-containing protein n=1 Tax=Sporocytophaga myxococcoides TaxID=153721 RepID=UPI0004134DE6|nr:T9SS type A sorting domain-containing protein [Sporocytophaga myxococcoides]
MYTRYLLFALFLFISLLTHAKKVLIGGSGGYLNYSNATSTLSLLPGDTIAIQPGKYSGFTFGNIRGTASKKIAIINNKGLVEITGSNASNLNTCSNVVFSGNGANGIKYGFYFHDINGRAMQLDNKADSITISYARFERVSDYTIRINADKKYDGTEVTLIENIRFLHLSFKKTGTPIDWGNFAYGSDLIGCGRNVEVAYCTIDSLNGGDGVRLNKVFDVNIHHNRFTNTGLLTSTHPGTFYLRGDGTIHHNFFQNIWGNGVRSEGIGLNEMGELTISNNIFLGSRKYSAIEVQTHPSDVTTSGSPSTKSCHYKIFNNTMGNQSARDYSAAMVDVYSLLDGKCEIRNNLGFNIEKDKAHVPTKNYIYNRQSPIATDVPDTSNNLYRRSFVQLGLVDTLNVYLKPNSIAVDKGMTLNTITDDFEGIVRPKGIKYDIGAREFVPPMQVVTSLEEIHNISGQILMYPNPCTSHVTLRSQSPLIRVSFSNVHGQLIFEQLLMGDFETQLNLERIENGIYFIRMETENGSIVKSLLKH